MSIVGYPHRQSIERNLFKPINIPIDKVKGTINNPDIQKRINFPSYRVMFSLKKYNNHYLIVDTRPKESMQSLLFSNAFIIHEQLLQNIAIENPLGVLELFANECGYQIEIEGQKGKLIHDAEIKIPNYNPTDDLQTIVQNNIILDNRLKITEVTEGLLGDCLASPKDVDGILHIIISLAYFIYVNKYTNYLRANNLM